MLLYARKRGRGETLVVELEAQEALRIMRENRGSDFQLGMLGSTDLNKAVKVYGEFAPYKKVSSVQELLAPFKKKEDDESKDSEGRRKLVHKRTLIQKYSSGKSSVRKSNIDTPTETKITGKA